MITVKATHKSLEISGDSPVEVSQMLSVLMDMRFSPAQQFFDCGLWERDRERRRRKPQPLYESEGDKAFQDILRANANPRP